MTRFSYAVFLPGAKWARTHNKKEALAFARQHGGYVTRMPYSHAGNGAWDAPTWRVSSEVIADFREDRRTRLISDCRF